MRHQDGNVLHAFLLRAANQHRISGRSCFKADRKKDHLLAGIASRNFQAIERGIDNAHIAALAT